VGVEPVGRGCAEGQAPQSTWAHCGRCDPVCSDGLASMYERVSGRGKPALGWPAASLLVRQGWLSVTRRPSGIASLAERGEHRS